MLTFWDKVHKYFFGKVIFHCEILTQAEYVLRVKKFVEEHSDNQVSICIKKYKEVKKDLDNCLNKTEEVTSHDWGTFNIEKGILEAHWWNDIHLVDDQPFVCYYNRKNKDKYILEQESLWFLREKKNGYRTLEGGLMLDTSEPYSYGSMIIKRCIPQALDYDKWYKEATERYNKYLEKQKQSVQERIKNIESELKQLKELLKDKK